uniref:RING-type domain-containing protein n=1 Tax=Salix viminalis TaxID=40686 RepID=A0A6N2NAG3_SALVM
MFGSSIHALDPTTVLQNSMFYASLYLPGMLSVTPSHFSCSYCYVAVCHSLAPVLGYNMNMGSAERGASDDQISSLPSWRFKAVDTSSEFRNNGDCNSAIASEDLECCICLAKYKDKEEVRKLPCSHMFHLKCVDQWLRIISCCPLCKQELER